MELCRHQLRWRRLCRREIAGRARRSCGCHCWRGAQNRATMQRNSITLLQYAGFLLVVGLASAFYSAADRTAGWNPHGASGLYACGGSAVVIAILGWLTSKGKEW